MPQSLIVVPTYNERDNVRGDRRAPARRPARHRAAVRRRQLARRHRRACSTSWPPPSPRIHVMHRAGKLGLGTAYVEGFGWGLARGYDVPVRDGRRRQPRSEVPARRCSRSPRTAPTSSSARATSRAAAPRTGASAASSSRAAAASTRARSSASTSATSPPASSAGGGPRSRRSISPTITSNGYSFQIEMKYRALQQGPAARRDPDRVRRSAGRAVEDVARDLRGGPAEGLGAALRATRAASISR